MKMKTMKLTAVFIAALFLAIGCAGGPKAGADNNGIDTAMRKISDYLNERIPKGNKVVFLNVKSDWPDLSEYILSGLSENAVNDRVFSVVDRQQLDSIRAELNFQWSGEVSDKSAQEIGQMLGAQTIVSGAVSKLGDEYRIQVRAITVKTAEVQGQTTQTIDGKAKRIVALTKKVVPAGSGTSGSTSTAGGTKTQTGTTAPSGTQSPGRQTPAQTAQIPAKLKSGTYTFFPRLRPYRGATANQGVYLWKIVVKGDYMSIFLTRSATGNGANDEPDSAWRGGGHQERHYILQDLDNPAKSWNPSGGYLGGYSWSDEGYWFNFKGVTATRFSFTDTYQNPLSVFDEIDLSKAQYEP